MVVWNSQGAKWDDFWNYWIAPIAPDGMGNLDDVAGMLIECGWAPWIYGGDVVENADYDMLTDAYWFNAAGAQASDFCKGVASTRRWKATWVPWVMNLDAMKTNTRCSMAAVVLPSALRFMGTISSNQGLIRPVLISGFAIGHNRVLTVLQVHLVSSKRAVKELDALTARLSRLIPEGTAGLVVGDMNVNLLKTPYQPADHRWFVLSTNPLVATQQSGGCLDWALLYDPKYQYREGARAEVLEEFKTGANKSDHSVLMYSLDV